MSRELRPALAWETVERCFPDRDPIFSKARTSELLVSMTRPLAPGRTVEELANALSHAAADYAFDLWGQSQPTADGLSAQVRIIRSHCTALLNSLGITGEREVEHSAMYPFLTNGAFYAAAVGSGEGSGRGAVLHAVQSVADLRRWADQLAVVSKRQSALHPTPGNRPKNKAYSRLLCDLTRIYYDGWDALPGISMSRGVGSVPDAEEQEASTSFEAALYAKGTPLPLGFLRFLCEVLRALNERGIEAPTNPEAVAKAWSRLPPDDKFRFDVDKSTHENEV